MNPSSYLLACLPVQVGAGAAESLGYFLRLVAIAYPGLLTFIVSYLFVLLSPNFIAYVSGCIGGGACKISKKKSGMPSIVVQLPARQLHQAASVHMECTFLCVQVNYLVAGRALALSGLNVVCLQPNWISRAFVTSDVLSFVIQASPSLCALHEFLQVGLLPLCKKNYFPGYPRCICDGCSPAQPVSVCPAEPLRSNLHSRTPLPTASHCRRLGVEAC